MHLKCIAPADFPATDGSGRIISYDRKSGTNRTLTWDEGVQNICGELVAGLPLAPGR